MAVEALFGAGGVQSQFICWQDREIRFDSNAQDIDCRKGEELVAVVVRTCRLRRTHLRQPDTLPSYRHRLCEDSSLRVAHRRPWPHGHSLALVCAQENVEDTKGNNGDLGELRVTNLRLVWVSKKNRKTNICIGHNCINSVTIKSANSRLKGEQHRLVPCCAACSAHNLAKDMSDQLDASSFLAWACAGETQALFVLTKYHNQRFEFIFTAMADGTQGMFSSVQVRAAGCRPGDLWHGALGAGRAS
jgi:hypothetical protein